MSVSIEIKDNTRYASVDYWNERYSNEEEYDWLGDYELFKNLIHRHVQDKCSKILMVGCGNSQLSEQMFQDGYQNIISTDISEVCIENQQKAFPHLTWKVADIKNLKDFEDGTFDIVIKKATLDALLVGEKSQWDPSEEAEEGIGNCLSEISRVLKPQNGRFLSLTFAQPHFRTPFYAKTKYEWSVDHETFGTGFHYYCFIMTKGQSLHEVHISSATYISKLTLNVNQDVISSSDEEDFTSKLDLSFESDKDSLDSLPNDEIKSLKIE